MRKKFLSFIAIGLLLFSLLQYLSHFTATTKTQNRPHNKKSLKLIEENIKAEKENHSAKPAAITSADSATEKPCWHRIRDQYQTNSDYVVENKLQLNGIVGEWFYIKDTASTKTLHESSVQGKFFLALAKADLLEGRKIDRNDEQALSLLSEVLEADPDNSAPLLYAAIIKKRQGKEAEAQDLIRQARDSKFFKTYIRDFTFNLFDGVKTPSDLLSAHEIWSTAPIPDFLSLKKLLKDSKEVQITEKLLTNGLDSTYGRIQDLSWTPVEYAIGKSVLDSINKGNNYPSYKSLVAERPNPFQEASENAFRNLNSTCDLNSLQAQVTTVREYLDAVRSDPNR